MPPAIISAIVMGTRVEAWRPGPYVAKTASTKGDPDWPSWIVVGGDGRINCLGFPDKPGAVLTSRYGAEAIAKALNDAAAMARHKED